MGRDLEEVREMKDWTGGTQAVMATLNASSHATTGERGFRDYYATPLKAVTELLRLERFGPEIWECACGEMAISKPLIESGYSVRSSDIEDRGDNEIFDFLGIDNQSWGGDIVTNPPFAKATEFLEKALSIVTDGAKIAFFLRVQFLEGVKRRTLFEKHPPRRVWVASRTLRCAKNGNFNEATGNAATYCWFIWEKGFTGRPTLGWFN